MENYWWSRIDQVHVEQKQWKENIFICVTSTQVQRCYCLSLEIHKNDIYVLKKGIPKNPWEITWLKTEKSHSANIDFLTLLRWWSRGGHRERTPTFFCPNSLKSLNPLRSLFFQILDPPLLLCPNSHQQNVKKLSDSHKQPLENLEHVF